MRKTSQDAGDSSSITSGMDGDHKKSGPGLIKSTRNSIKRRVQSLSHESDDAVIEPLLQKDKPETSTSVKFLSKSKVDDKRKDSLKSISESTTEISLVTNGLKEKLITKMSCTAVGTVCNTTIATKTITSANGTPLVAPVKTQVLVDIEGQKPIVNKVNNTLIFTTAKIHVDEKLKQMEPILITPVPIISTIENSNFKPLGAIRDKQSEISESMGKKDTFVPLSKADTSVKNSGESTIKSMTSETSTINKADIDKRSMKFDKSNSKASEMNVESQIFFSNVTPKDEIHVGIKNNDAYLISSKLKTNINNVAVSKSELTSGPSSKSIENRTIDTEKTIKLDSIANDSNFVGSQKTGKENDRLEKKELISTRSKDLNEISRIEKGYQKVDVKITTSTKSSILSQQPIVTSMTSSKDPSTSFTIKSSDTKIFQQTQNVNDDEKTIKIGDITKPKLDKTFSHGYNMADVKNIKEGDRAKPPCATSLSKTIKSDNVDNEELSKPLTTTSSSSSRSSIKVMNVASVPKLDTKTVISNNSNVRVSKLSESTASSSSVKTIDSTSSVSGIGSKPAAKSIPVKPQTNKSTTTASTTKTINTKPSSKLVSSNISKTVTTTASKSITTPTTKESTSLTKPTTIVTSTSASQSNKAIEDKSSTPSSANGTNPPKLSTHGIINTDDKKDAKKTKA